MGRENHWAHMSAPLNEDMLADVMELHQALAYMHSQHCCGCKHPACNTCGDDKENYELIERIKEKYQKTDSWKEVN